MGDGGIEDRADAEREDQFVIIERAANVGVVRCVEQTIIDAVAVTLTEFVERFAPANGI